MGKESQNLALNWDFSKLPKLNSPLLIWNSMITLTPLQKDELLNTFLTPLLLFDTSVKDKFNEDYPIHGFRVLNKINTKDGIIEFKTSEPDYLGDWTEDSVYSYGPKPYPIYYSRNIFGNNPKYFYTGWYSKDGKNMDGYIYYDPTIKYDRILNYSPYPSIYRKMFFKLSDLDNAERNKRNKGNYIMDYGENPEMLTLHTKGKLVNLASFPVLLADSIAFNAGRAGIPIWDAFGIIGLEGTFIGDLTALRKGINTFNWNQYDYTNNHAFFVNPYTDIMESLNKENPKTDKDIINLEHRIQYSLEHPETQFIERTKHYSPHVMTDAFMRYVANPNGYNHGSKKAYGITYSEAINRLVKELKTSPELQEYIKIRGLKLYNKGKELYGK